MVEETMSLQEKGWERRSRKGMKHHYEYIAPDGETFENMAAALNYAAEGNEGERKGDGEETASVEGGCARSEQQKLDSNDGEEEEEAGSGYNRVRGWGRATEAVAMQEKGWQRRSVRVRGHYDYISPDGMTLANMANAQGKEDEREWDGEEAASAGSDCDEREQQSRLKKGEINLWKLRQMGFQNEGENIRALTDSKVSDSLY